MPLILPSNSISAVGYEVANSLRFDGSSDYLNRTFGTATNRLKLTISVWLKKSDLTTGLFFTSYNSASFRFQFYFDGSDRLGLLNVDSGTNNVELITNRVFRDLSAFYNLQAVIDTTQSTASDRVKIYVNGVQETSFSTATYPSQNADMSLGAGSYSCQLGRYGGGSDYFSGYMSEVIYLDGQTLDPTSFGEFDEDTGIWKPIDVSGLTFGNEGFYLDFENSGSLGADVSGNGNNFTVNNLTSIDQTTDTPTNNYATLNPLASSSTPIFSEGNLHVNCNSLNSWNQGVPATIVMSSGAKWYWEVKNVDATYYNYLIPAFIKASYYSNLISGSGMSSFFVNSNGYMNGIQTGGGGTDLQVYRAGSNQSTESFPYLNGDIVSFAVDLVNRKAWLGKNGTWLNSGDPVNGTNETWSTSDIDTNTDYVPTIFYYYTAKGSINFGNPAFTISSGNSDGNGYGNFEYAVPSGYYALNTKNLAEFG